MSLRLRLRHRSRRLGTGAVAAFHRLRGRLRVFQTIGTVRAPLGRLRGLLSVIAFKQPLGSGRVRGGPARLTGYAYAFGSSGVATQLAVTTQPSGAVSGVAFTQQPVVRLQNASGSNVVESGVIITAYLSSGTGTLGGTKQVATDSIGRATFTNLAITGTGSHTVSFHALMSNVQTIWSDDVEIDRSTSYFEYNPAAGAFGRASVDGSMRWRATIAAGTQAEWGNLKLGMGRMPSGGGLSSVGPAGVDFGKVTIECDMYHSVNNLTNSQDKFLRLLVLSDSSWSEAAKSQCWSNGTTHLQLDPTTTVVDDTVTGVGPADYAHQTYLGATDGTNVVFGATATTPRTYRHEMTLNTPGNADGSTRLYIDGVLDIEKTGLNFVGRWTGYGINTCRWENYRTDGIAVSNNRMYDNLLVTGQARAIVAASAITVGAGVSAWLSDDFSSYADTTALQSASWLHNGDYTTWGTTSGMSLDTTEGYGASTRCMKASWDTGDAGFGVELWTPSTGTTEYWTEIWMKLSTSWTSDGPSGPNPDWKAVFWLLRPAGSLARNEIKIGEYGTLNRLSTYKQGGPDTFIFAANNLNNDSWFRLRAHNKIVPGVASGGIFNCEFWDGVNAPQQTIQENVNFSAYSNMDVMYIGANRNRPAPAPMWCKWGKIVLYNTDPGWGI